MAGIGISISDDALGYGKAISGLVEARQNQNCGPNPLCIGFLGNCKKRQEAYRKCIENQQNLDFQAKVLKNQQKSSSQNNQEINPQLLLGIAIVVIIIILISRRKK